MRRVAIYARYSTKFQKEISVKDQIAYCKQHIERQGDMQHTHTFFDKEKSGGFIATRPGLNSLLEALKDNLFDIVLVENLDRLTRNPGDSHKLFEMIEYHDLELHSVNKGKVNTLLVGFKGTMNALYISDTADKVKRSQAERARQGLFSAGVAYGYRVKTDAVDEKGKRLYGVREIHHEEARIVRRIFDLYIEGWGSKKIASLLNAEGVPSPSGGYWTSGAILGTKSREVRILSNQTYIGKLVYNKTRRKKHPITGKLSFCPRPENERITSDVPNLRIISDDRWQQALARRNRVKSTIFTLKKHTLSGSSKPLTGLIYCGVCGHKALLANHQRYVCGHYRMYRKCKNARSIRAPILLEEMFSATRAHVEKTDWRHEFEIFLNRSTPLTLTLLQKEKVSIEKSISSLVSALESGVDVIQIKERIQELERKRIDTDLKIKKICTHKMRWASAIVTRNEYVRDKFGEGLEMFEHAYTQDAEDKNGYTWREVMSLIVEKIVTTPIPDKKRGMTIDVKISPMEGWAEFYRRITVKRARG